MPDTVFGTIQNKVISDAWYVLHDAFDKFLTFAYCAFKILELCPAQPNSTSRNR